MGDLYALENQYKHTESYNSNNGADQHGNGETNNRTSVEKIRFIDARHYTRRTPSTEPMIRQDEGHFRDRTPSTEPMIRQDEGHFRDRLQYVFLLIIWTIIIVIIGAVVISTLLLQTNRNNEDMITQEPVKTNMITQEPVKTIYDMTRNKDDTNKPCEDFWLHSCGNYMKVTNSKDIQLNGFETNIKSEMQRITDEEVIRLLEEPNTEFTIEPVKMVKKLYSSCMKQENRDKIMKSFLKYTFEKLKGMPITDHVSILRTYRRVTGQLPWFKYYIWQDFENIGKHINLQFSYSHNKRSIYGDVAHIKHLFPDFVNVERIMGFFHQMTQKTQSSYFKRFDGALGVKRYTSAELSKLLPGLDLVSIFGDILDVANEKVNTFTFITPDTEILKWFSNLIIETDKMDFLNVVFVEIFQHFFDKFPTDKRQPKDTNRNFSSTPLLKKSCLDISHLAGDVLGWMYSEKYYDKQVHDEVNSIVGYLLRAMKIVLSETEWLDKWSKDSALAKLKNLTRSIHIGPRHSADMKEELIKNYANINLTHNFVSNIATLSMRNTELRTLKMLQNNVNVVNQMDVSGVYNVISNSINIPIALMQPPIFRKNAHMGVNFGGLGTVIGHDIFHAFDVDEINIQRNGQWLSMESLHRYNLLKRTVLNTYSQYEIKSQSTKVNEERKVFENIDDLGGLKIAYEAYLLWKSEHRKTDKYLPQMMMTDLQLFFVAFAQTWCSSEISQPDIYAPNKARVQVPLKNSEDFAEAFKCSRGTNMNPEHKIEFWGKRNEYIKQSISSGSSSNNRLGA